MCICVHYMHTTPPCLPLHGVWVFSCLHGVLWESHLALAEDQHAARVLVAPAATAPKSALIPPPPPPTPQSLQRQTPRLPLAHSSAMLLGSSFVTTLARCLRQNAQWNKINTPIVKFSLSYSFAPSIPRYMSPSFVCLWRFGWGLFHVTLPGKRYLG